MGRAQPVVAAKGRFRTGSIRSRRGALAGQARAPPSASDNPMATHPGRPAASLRLEGVPRPGACSLSLRLLCLIVARGIAYNKACNQLRRERLTLEAIIGRKLPIGDFEHLLGRSLEQSDMVRGLQNMN